MTDCKKMMYYHNIIQVVAGLFLVTIIMADELTPTYEWMDETGKALICQKCPPGTYVAKHCSSKSNTICQACPEKHYTQHWNYLDKCRFCNVICQEGEQVKHDCNSTHNRVCECQPGYHLSGHYCIQDLQSDYQPDGDEDGDRLIIDYSEGLNNTTYVIRQLKLSLVIQKGKKHSLQKRIRKLLKTSDLNKAMLLQLLDSLKDGKLQNQEKNKLKRFLHQEES
ncbi:tumor necrosis factor receptor superfamily member 6B isoform X1 [Engystomops pustulosus]|uniref:tumor necrosis factor receptor superfamily member 6B isoform X1 n=1 Tax=Engystomops pustulosus TaxID=76066 RepID=UPI003AFB18E5